MITTATSLTARVLDHAAEIVEASTCGPKINSALVIASLAEGTDCNDAYSSFRAHIGGGEIWTWARTKSIDEARSALHACADDLRATS